MIFQRGTKIGWVEGTKSLSHGTRKLRCENCALKSGYTGVSRKHRGDRIISKSLSH